jgi:hypothetical protein
VPTQVLKRHFLGRITPVRFASTWEFTSTSTLCQ